MKNVLSVAIALCLMLLNAPAYANDKAFSEGEYEANEGYETPSSPLGHASSSAADSTISMSMVGWGLGLAIAIAIVAGVVHQSAASHSSSNTTDK